MVLALGSTMVSMAATGWAQENGTWVYYTSKVKTRRWIRLKNPGITGTTWMRMAKWRQTGW